MSKELFDLIQNYGSSIGLTVNIYYSSIVEWNIEIGFKPTRQKYIQKYGSPFIVVDNECDLNLAIAKTYIKLTEWLSENNGGY